MISHDQMRSANVDGRILDSLMREAAFQEELIDLGIRVPDEAALSAIQSRPEFQANGQFSAQAAQIVMSQLGMSETEFVEEHRNQVGGPF